MASSPEDNDWILCCDVILSDTALPTSKLWFIVLTVEVIPVTFVFSDFARIWPALVDASTDLTVGSSFVLQ